MQEILKSNENVKIFDKFNRFFIKQKEFITLEEFDKIVKIKNLEEVDKSRKIYNMSTLSKATKNDVSFLINKKYTKDLLTTKAGFCFVNQEIKNLLPSHIVPIVVDNPHFAYCMFLDTMYVVPLFTIEAGISPKANVDSTAKIGKNVEIQAGAFIDKNVVIGDNCKICANAVINHDCIIGNGTFIGANATISYAEIGQNVVIQNGASIGQCGYGFAHNAGFNYKIPQLGIVKIGNFVEIGANTCIDRAAFEETSIGDITKLDNSVHIAHNVKIGMGCFITAQVGIAGSAKIGNFVQMGGQAGVAGHVNVGDFVQMAGQTGVIGDVATGSLLGGCPSMPVKDWLKSSIVLRKLINKKGK